MRWHPSRWIGADGRVNRPGTGAPKYEGWPGARRRVALVDGATIHFAGIDFRIGRAGGRWTMTPLTPRFPQWLVSECEGSRVRVGRP